MIPQTRCPVPAPPSRPTAWALLIVLLAAPQLLAQTSAARENGEAPREVFSEVLSVEVINLDVRVTDGRGRPVTGLERDDFALFQDGEPVEILNFSYTAIEGSEPEESAPAPDGPSTRAQTASERLWVVLFVDQSHLHPSNRPRVLRDLERFVTEGVGPEARLMVVDHDRGPRVRQGFTADREAVLDALREVAEHGTASVKEGLSDRLRAVSDINTALAGCDELALLDALNSVRRYAAWVQGEVQGTIGALEAVTESLQGLPGRTVLLYVGDGMEQQPAADLFHDLAVGCPTGSMRSVFSGEEMSRDLTGSMQKLTAQANALGVSFYTFGGAGLRTDVDTEFGGVTSLVGRRTRQANLDGSLFLLADETGGKAVLNANRLAPELEEALEDAASAYSLGFTPDHPGEGAIHTLRVEVRPRDGAGRIHQVRYRKRYRHLAPEDRLVGRMLATLRHGAEDNPLGVRLRVGPPAPGSDGALRTEGPFLVPLEITVPYDAIDFTPSTGETGRALGHLVLLLSVREPSGQWTGIRKKEITVKRPLGPGAARFYRLIVPVELPSDRATAAVGVEDVVGGRSSYLRTELKVRSGPERESQGPA